MTPGNKITFLARIPYENTTAGSIRSLPRHATLIQGRSYNAGRGINAGFKNLGFLGIFVEELAIYPIGVKSTDVLKRSRLSDTTETGNSPPDSFLGC